MSHTVPSTLLLMVCGSIAMYYSLSVSHTRFGGWSKTTYVCPPAITVIADIIPSSIFFLITELPNRNAGFQFTWMTFPNALCSSLLGLRFLLYVFPTITFLSPSFPAWRVVHRNICTRKLTLPVIVDYFRCHFQPFIVSSIALSLNMYAAFCYYLTCTYLLNNKVYLFV